MRIDSNIPNLQGVSADRPENSSVTANRARTTSQPDGESIPEDTVSITSLTNQAMQTSPMREDMVESLRQSVANGQYQLDPHAIAAAMVGQA